VDVDPLDSRANLSCIPERTEAELRGNLVNIDIGKYDGCIVATTSMVSACGLMPRKRTYSSRVTRLRPFAAASATFFPDAVEPVKEILLTSG
jgi:hypothetical protein